MDPKIHIFEGEIITDEKVNRYLNGQSQNREPLHKLLLSLSQLSPIPGQIPYKTSQCSNCQMPIVDLVPKCLYCQQETQGAFNERRTHRMLLQIPVLLKQEQNLALGYLLNFSRKGACLTTVEHLKNFSLGLFANPFQASGDIRWEHQFLFQNKKAYVLGIEFSELDILDKAFLTQSQA